MKRPLVSERLVASALFALFALTTALSGSAFADAQPVITSFTPTSGPPGTIISISGSGFTGAIFASFRGIRVAASLTIESDTLVEITVPAILGVGEATLGIGNPTHTGYGPSNFAVSGSAAHPVISSFSPTSGPVGTIITVSGSNLGGVTQSTIGTSSDAKVHGNYATSVQLTVPSDAPIGAATIAVRTAGGPAYAASPFQVTTDPPSILNNTSHIAGSALNDLTVLAIQNTGLSGPTSSTLVVNQTCPGTTCINFLSIVDAITAAQTIGANNYAVYSSTLVTAYVPYQVINQSSGGYLAIDDFQINGAGTEGIVYSTAYCGTPFVGDQPPAAFVTVLPNYVPAQPVAAAGCGYAQGIEFSIPATPIGCTTNCVWTPVVGGGSMDVTSASATTEAMSAVLAGLKSRHPLWTWGDVKSVLRTTASNWNSGYVGYNANGPAFGYGNIDYPSADGYTGNIYLQPPNLNVNLGIIANAAYIQIFPFRTTRRAGEMIYAFNSKPILPAPGANNEYSYSQISSLVSSYGGSVFYSSTGLPDQFNVFTHNLVNGAPIYLLAFTVDSLPDYTTANFSRAETAFILGPY